MTTIGIDPDSPGVFVYALYERPLDYPDSFVVRRYKNTQCDAVPMVVELTLEAARAKLRAQVPGLVKTAPYPSDDPCIKEVWL